MVFARNDDRQLTVVDFVLCPCVNEGRGLLNVPRYVGSIVWRDVAGAKSQVDREISIRHFFVRRRSPRI